MLQLPAALPADISIAEGIKARINVPYSGCCVSSKSRDSRGRSDQINAGHQPMNVHLTHVDFVIGHGVCLVLRPDDLHNGHHLSGNYQNDEQKHESGIFVWISLDLRQALKSCPADVRSAVSIGVSMSSQIPNQIREAPILKNGTDKSPLSTGEQVMPTGRSLPEIPLYGPTGDRSSSFAASASSDYGACACRFSPARDVDCAPSWRSSQRTETSYSHISYITTRPERGFMRTVSGRIFSMAALLAGLTQDTALTTNLFDVYIQYKKDTRDIVSWLLSHHPTKGAGVRKRISVRDLIAIAECICAEAMDMPEVIAFQFRQAITARNYLSKAFRRVSKADGEPSSTENHEFFTSSLTKIYINLCRNCSKRKDTCSHQSRTLEDTSHNRTRSNLFETLQQSGTETENATLIDEQSYQNKSTEHKGRGKDILSDEAPSRIVDDGLSDAFELYQQVHEFQQIFGVVQAVWQDVAEGSSHLVTAAAVTNAAYTRLGEVEQRLCTSCKITDPADLLNSYRRLRDTFVPKDATSTASELSAMGIISETHECWQAMLSLRSAAAEDGFAEKAVRPQLPPQVSLRQGPDASVSDAQCRYVLLSNLAQCITGSRPHNAFIHSGSPVLPDIGFFISHKKTPNNCLHCATGLALLMSSYKVYSFAMPAGQNTSSCRVHALRFAQSAISQLGVVLDDPTMPCRCHGTLAFRLEQLKHDFEDYLRTKMFDLFFQSPWVCGGQILQMMHALNYYGLRLFAYKSYVGSVIHMYNVLRQLHGFGPIAILDAVSKHFGNLLFPGGQPRGKNYRNCYIRYLGGRLRFHDKALHQNGCHGLSIPVHTAKATAGFSSDGVESDARFDGGRFSLLFKIQARQYRIDEATWDVIGCKDQATDGEGEEGVPSSTRNTYKSSARRQKSSGGTAASKRRCHSNPSGYFSDTSTRPVSRRLRGLQKTLDAELKSSLTTASIELLPLYLTCARIIDKISDTYHGSAAKRGQYCLCCAENLVTAADRCREAKGFKVQKEVVDLVETCKRTIKKEFGDEKQ